MANKMPGYKPTIAFPFAVNSLVTTAQLFWIMKGARVYYTSRLVPCFCAAAAVMFLIPLTAQLPLGYNFWGCFCLLFTFAALCGTIQSAIFSMAGGLPSSYMSVCLLGASVCGVVCSLLRALTVIIFPVTFEALETDEGKRNQFYSALVFFTFSVFFMLLCAAI